jgi:transcriptional regulator with XRE-family HTH domain
MPQSFGARLRHRREEQKITLAAIADQTKIKSSLLGALEMDDVSRWPGGIFRRAYVRAYAEAIGLDADAVLREFLTAYPDPQEAATEVLTPGAEADTSRAGSGPPTRIRMMLSSAMGTFSQRRRRPVESDPAVAQDFAAGGPPPAELVTPPAPEVIDLEETNGAVADATTVTAPASSEPDFQAVARLCTELGRVEDADHVQPLLQEAARLLDARGLIVWVWDECAARLRPTLAHGYSRRVLAQLPTVARDADNPTAAAFRSASAVSVNDDTSGALVIPLMTAPGCVGVLALELPRGTEDLGPVRAVATIFAAMLVQLTGGAWTVEVRPEVEPELHALAAP